MFRYVEAPLTGLFLASDDGKWNGQHGFNHSLASYKFDFISLRTNDAAFSQGIQSLKEDLTLLGQRETNAPIHYNLLIWMHFSSTIDFHDNKVQRFSFTAKPGDVFNREYALFWTSGQINSQIMNCHEIPTLRFDRESGRMSVSFSYNNSDPGDPYGSSACYDLVPPEKFGYDGSKRDKYRFSFDMDLTSMTSALSVNLGIVNYVYTFDEAEGSQLMGIYNGNQFLYLKRLFDPLFPRMDPIWCFQLTECKANCSSYTYLGEGPTYFDGKCFLKIADSYVIPSFHHFNSSCQECPSSFAGDNIMDPCQYFDLLNNLLYLPSMDFDQDVFNVLELFNRFENSKTLNDEMFRAFDTGNFTQLCGDSNCTLLILDTYDKFDRAVSPYYYNLDYGHCNDSTKKESLDLLGETPPSLLVEEYYRCQHSTQNAIITSAGIAGGNTLCIAPILSWAILFCLVHVYYWRCSKEPMHEEHREDVKQSALDELISRLLDTTSGKPTKYRVGGDAVCQLAIDARRIAKSEANREESHENDAL